MRIRLSSIVSLGLAGMAGFMLFQTSQNVQQAEHQLRGLNAQLTKEGEALRVLEAEWDYLNRPDRLEELARQHLKMEPIDPALLVRDGGALPDQIEPIIPARKPDPALRRAVLAPSTPPAGSPPSVAAHDPVASPATSSPSSENFDTLINRLTDTEPSSGGAQ
ncbi:cell division protein FtsL [Micavibrio aeruginosavorus]|uniref:Cell division protein FtsL n=1 Tax=Micavibrio aeruginosavorus (strain ARL-13) TaxID=856793 RepID=G2KMC2_MICAA|nr:hypothetical protein [Micavibrio aeruginosavorus]AEP10216.1 hypothetical protein MICA_1907 [Micavibrio aeruginosavorus ARL-13]